MGQQHLSLVIGDLRRQIVDLGERLQFQIDQLQLERDRVRILLESAGIKDSGVFTVLEAERPNPLPKPSLGYAVRLEELPPNVPSWCVDFLIDKLQIGREQAGIRAVAAFDCGFWVRFAIDSHTGFLDNFSNRHLLPRQWILGRGKGVSKPLKSFERRELLSFIVEEDEETILVPFASEAEVFVFCCGADLPVPPLVSWRRLQ